MQLKNCSKCGADKPLDDFYKHPDGLFGRRPDCKACVKERSKQYYNNNRSRVREINNKWSEAHPDAVKASRLRQQNKINDDPALRARETARTSAAIRASKGKSQRAWKKRNATPYQAKQREYAAAYRRTPEWKAWFKQYRSKKWQDPEFRAKKVADQAARLANQNRNGGRFLSEQFQGICAAYGNKCLCCARTDRKLTADHVVPVSQPGGNSWITNIQPLCGPCNSSKGDRTIDYRPFPVPEEIVALLPMEITVGARTS